MCMCVCIYIALVGKARNADSLLDAPTAENPFDARRVSFRDA